MRREHWEVMSEATRPAVGFPDECCYCHQPVGEEHSSTCVCRERTIVLELTVQFVKKVPESWGEEQVNYFHNHSRWCVNNALDSLSSLAAHAGCVCEFSKVNFVREACEEDEDRFGITVKDKQRE